MEKRAHILVVDDEQAIADLVVNLLVAEGMDALACYSGQAAWTCSPARRSTWPSWIS